MLNNIIKSGFVKKTIQTPPQKNKKTKQPPPPQKKKKKKNNPQNINNNNKKKTSKEAFLTLWLVQLNFLYSQEYL